MKCIEVKEDGSVRPFTDSGWYMKNRIISELTRLSEEYRSTGWKMEDPYMAYQAIKDEFQFVVLPDGGVMAVSTNKPWFSREWVLCEEFIGAGVTTEQAAFALRCIAKAIRVNRFEVGTRATPGAKHQAAARLYQRAGLTCSTITLGGTVDEQEDSSQGDGPTQAP